MNGNFLGNNKHCAVAYHMREISTALYPSDVPGGGTTGSSLSVLDVVTKAEIKNF